MTKKTFFVSALGLIAPMIAFAATTWVQDVRIIPEGLEDTLEVVNLLLSIVAAAFAIKLAALSQGGSLEKTWNWLAVAVTLFAGVEVVGSLDSFGFIRVQGGQDALEFIMIVVFLVVFYRTRKDLLRKVLGK